MKQIAILIALLMVVSPAVADDSPLSQVAEGLSKIAKDMKPAASVEQKGRAVTLSYKTRKFMVHSTDKLGRHSEKARETVGPRYDGLIVIVALQDGRYGGAASPGDHRGPYWTTFFNAYPIAKGKRHLDLRISYGSRTDRETIKKVKELLESMVDNDPNVKAKGLGAHNKAIDGHKK